MVSLEPLTVISGQAIGTGAAGGREKQEAWLQLGEGSLMPAFGWTVEALGSGSNRSQLHPCPLKTLSSSPVSLPAGSS